MCVMHRQYKVMKASTAAFTGPHRVEAEQQVYALKLFKRRVVV